MSKFVAVVPYFLGQPLNIFYILNVFFSNIYIYIYTHIYRTSSNLYTPDSVSLASLARQSANCRVCLFCFLLFVLVCLFEFCVSQGIIL